MKFIITTFIVTFFIVNNYAFSGPLDSLERGMDKLFGKEPEGPSDVKATKKKRADVKQISKKQADKPCKYKRGVLDSVEGSLDKLFGKEVSTKSDATCSAGSTQVKKDTTSEKKYFFKEENPHNISVYAGTWDTIDKEGDDQTNLLGVEHKNNDLFRNTWLGRFSPTTGALVTGKNSIYLYTGVEADYNLGPINISPSF